MAGTYVSFLISLGKHGEGTLPHQPAALCLRKSVNGRSKPL